MLRPESIIIYFVFGLLALPAVNETFAIVLAILFFIFIAVSFKAPIVLLNLSIAILFAKLHVFIKNKTQQTNKTVSSVVTFLLTTLPLCLNTLMFTLGGISISGANELAAQTGNDAVAMITGFYIMPIGCYLNYTFYKAIIKKAKSKSSIT